ncbi:histidinol-phosphatase [Phaeovibrio sulfidiphilus]|uniref:Histidinol-phosphatase n=1 Tax=Phaeovibrio sulfidiphilus TaxID=1220600 RepID=A0A8J6YWF0_9PROT|nr:histidinol-phosphatase [Phaeovibrio sulfidiphilus]MBE1237694.1 histidinol-phosphatase [Phaeovibrio sulfidiphilus]
MILRSTAFPDLSMCVALAHELAEISAGIIRPLFRSPALNVDDKADLTPVTAADRDSEAAMRERIREVFPDHGVIGEEFPAENPDAEFVWVLDPVDGTGALVSGLPTFGTLIGLCHRGTPVLGLINQPISDERWIGLTGEQTLFNGERAKVRAVRSLDQATIFTTALDCFASDSDRSAFERLAGKTRLRRFGCDCYAYGLLALGWCDLVCETGLKVHDFTALVPVITGAGGRMTGWDNRPLDLSSDGRVLASTGEPLHREALEILTGTKGATPS